MVKERMCCVCRERKTGLLRIARIDGKFSLDEKGNANGRGCYLCKGCVDKAIKTKALNRSFKSNVNNEIYELLAKHNNQ